MSERDWLIDGYAKHLKRIKKKSTPKTFQRYIAKYFDSQGVDIRYLTCFPAVMLEIFSQIKQLKQKLRSP